jgi:signal transduction histidine kinase
MEAIRQSGTFRRLDKAFTSTDDELGKLGKMFNEMIGQIESQVNRQKRFMSDVSHELRTPLTIIESYASLLKRWGFDDPELRKESIEAIHSEAVRLKGMVSEMLKLAQAEEAQLQAVKTDLASIVRKTAAAMERTFRRKITVEPFSGKAIVLGDPEKLKQLFIIILDNAVKYSQKPVTVRILRMNGRVAVQTIDKGTGVSEKELPFIFDRFYRTDQSRNRSTGGHGLGLAIAKKIVDQHEGAIRMDSKPGFGTVVTVSLPLADD